MFAKRLARELERRGHRALHINFCAGDLLFWRGRKTFSYRGKPAAWPGYLRDFITQHAITDMLYYGDRTPYHIAAAKLARRLGINAYAYEFGYLRPDWLTLEKGGMGAWSHFPNDPEQIRQIAQLCPKPDMKIRFPYTKGQEIFHEVTYNLTTFFTPFLYPFYDSGRYYNVLVEYISGIPGLFLEKRNDRKARALIRQIISEKDGKFFVFPLQLQSDYQLRCNTWFTHQREAMEMVLASFAAHAAPDSRLIFKQHPLDNGWEGWPRIIHRLTAKYDVARRVDFIIGGDLDRLLRHARGCVTINSTVGMHALVTGCPVKPLGAAIYDVPRLCHQGGLDTFWTEPEKPDPALVADFVRALAGTIQIKGNFFTPEGQKSAIKIMAGRLENQTVNGFGAFVDPPPRLARLQAQKQARINDKA